MQISPSERDIRRRLFPTATAAQWHDWRWQLRHRIRDAATIARALPDLSARELRGLHTPNAWRMPLAITPYYLALLADDEPDGPLRRTLLPDVREARHVTGEYADPLGEAVHTVAPGLIRAYPHKVLLLATGDCASFCRYCTRARTAGKSTIRWNLALAWLRRNPDITDVLISGGDPFTLDDTTLDKRLAAIRAMSHIKLIRIGTKVPAVLPQRITSALVSVLRRYRPLWLSVHFTHPAELTPAAAAACRRLVDAGIPLMNQTVLLRGINDDVQTLTRLNEELLLLGVKPYYLHQGDLAAGTAHLRSTVARGRNILRQMSGCVPGYAIPLFMFDPPGGGGKMPLGPAG